jgi:hypothetical protein
LLLPRSFGTTLNIISKLVINRLVTLFHIGVKFIYFAPIGMSMVQFHAGALGHTRKTTCPTCGSVVTIVYDKLYDSEKPTHDNPKGKFEKHDCKDGPKAFETTQPFTINA